MRISDWSSDVCSSDLSGAGRFVDAPAVLLDNQQRDERPGVRVYRVFQPAATGAAPLLVELGWLPLPGDRQLPEVQRPSGEMQVAGLLAPPQIGRAHV